MANEKVLIDADALKDAIRDDAEINGRNYARLKMHIDEAPTVDAVEVVRCKDCRYCQRDAYGLWCFNDYEHSLQPDDFCSYGERKDNE